MAILLLQAGGTDNLLLQAGDNLLLQATSADVTIGLSPVAGRGTTPTHVVTAGQEVTLAAATARGVIPAPTVAAAAEIVLAALAGVGTPVGPSLTLGQEVAAGPVTTAAAPVGPSLVLGQEVAPAAVPGVGTPAAPTIQTDAPVVLVAAAAGAGQSPAVVVASGQEVALAPAQGTGTPVAPVVTSDADALVVLAAAIGRGASPAPAVATAQELIVPAVASSAAAPAATITTAAEVAAPAATGLGTPLPPSVENTSAIDLVLATLAGAGVTIAPTVETGAGPDPGDDVPTQGSKTPLEKLLRAVLARLVDFLDPDGDAGSLGVPAQRIFFARIKQAPRWTAPSDVVLRLTSPRPVPGAYEGHGVLGPLVRRGLLVQIRTRLATDISDRVNVWLLSLQSKLEDLVLEALVGERPVDPDAADPDAPDVLVGEEICLADGDAYRDELSMVPSDDPTWGSSILTFTLTYAHAARDLPEPPGL